MNKELVRTIKFTLFSLSAGLIQIGSFTLFLEIFKWSYPVSYLVSLVLSVLWNFTLNREFTFKSANNVPKAMFLVFLYYLAFTPISTYVGGILVKNLSWNEYLVEVISMITNFVTEFLYDRFVVFRDSIDTKVKKKKR